MLSNEQKQKIANALDNRKKGIVCPMCKNEESDTTERKRKIIAEK